MTRIVDPASRMDALYSELAPQVMRIVRANLKAPDGLIEDACQSAWGALLINREELPQGCELGWLVTTATREALRLIRAERDETPLEVEPEPTRLDDYRATQPEPERALELRERLAEIRRLPVRQQRMVWLHGLGYEYREIAAVTGDSRRTVERQLTRARQRLAQLAQE
jgi:RNA polymerase sigma factor (sigma-70 family)